jgi:hypothetical protein
MELSRREKKNETLAERDRIADYIDTYHRMTGEVIPGNVNNPPPPDSE